MPFKVNARTIFHLGADLIHSDGIAFYELIKNAFDAGSPDVEINVVVRIPSPTYAEKIRELRRECDELKATKVLAAAVGRWQEEISAAVDMSVPGSDRLRKRLLAADSLEALLCQLEGARITLS